MDELKPKRAILLFFLTKKKYFYLETALFHTRATGSSTCCEALSTLARHSGPQLTGNTLTRESIWPPSVTFHLNEYQQHKLQKHKGESFIHETKTENSRMGQFFWVSAHIISWSGEGKLLDMYVRDLVGWWSGGREEI
jgi:hypothetical protein